MSEKTYTEREVVMRERAAWSAGYRAVCVKKSIEETAAANYPLPKRRKVVTFGDCEYRLSEDANRLEWRPDSGGSWREDVALKYYGDWGINKVFVDNCRAIVALNGQVWEDDA